MINLSSIDPVRETRAKWKAEGHRVALVPTMGNLHDGHMKLVERAKKEADRVMVSIFVNPLQFGPGEDLEAYPRTLSQDYERLQNAGVHALYHPTAQEMYPAGQGHEVLIDVPSIAKDLCGAWRPGHFSGVATVVAKLFNQVMPDVAIFGEKDYQQLLLIRKLVRELDYPIEILSVPTHRELDGLAMSSRNGYLDESKRKQAALIYASLSLAAEALKSGHESFSAIESNHVGILQSQGFSVDYFSIRRSGDLATPCPGEKDLVILVAARISGVRLIDNLRLQAER